MTTEPRTATDANEVFVRCMMASTGLPEETVRAAWRQMLWVKEVWPRLGSETLPDGPTTDKHDLLLRGVAAPDSDQKLTQALIYFRRDGKLFKPEYCPTTNPPTLVLWKSWDTIEPLMMALKSAKATYCWVGHVAGAVYGDVTCQL